MKLGELCAGYGGLGMAVEEVFGAELAWVSEYDEAPSKILKHHWPNVPNHGDMTKIDWAAIEPVDIISGGTPCQDLSHAGKRKGMTEGTRSNLWVNMREAIAIQKPPIVAWENVRGAYSAEADSDVEYCAGCMGRESDCNLRALGRVLGDLSDLGYDTQWRGLRAAGVGAPHARFRVFVLAANRDHLRKHWCRQGAKQDRRGQSTHSSDVTTDTSSSRLDWGQSFKGERWNSGLWREEVSHPGNSGTPRSHSPAEPKSVRGRKGGTEHAGQQGRLNAIERSSPTDWGIYESAIRRWEAVRGAAPAPTELTIRGTHRLSPRFAEWMMGLPDGWVTDPAIGISRNEQLKACGNGVVPQQAVAALKEMKAAFESREVAA